MEKDIWDVHRWVLVYGVSSSLGPRPSQVVVCHSFHRKRILHIYCSCVRKHLMRKVLKGLPFMQLSHESSRLCLGSLSQPFSTRSFVTGSNSRTTLQALPLGGALASVSAASITWLVQLRAWVGHGFRGSMQGAPTEPSLFYSRLNCKLQPPPGLTAARKLPEKHTKPNRNDSENCSS